MRRSLRHCRRVLVYGGFVLVILAAVAVGIANQLLPLVERHPDRIAAWLSERVGRPVRFESARAQWTRRGPLLTLENLRVGEGAQALAIGRAQLLIAMYTGLLPERPLTELRLRGLSLAVEREADGRWRFVGFTPDPSKDPLDALQGFGELQVSEARLAIRAPAQGIDAVLPRVDLRLRVGERRAQAGLRAWADRRTAPLSVTADIDRRSGSGALWAGGDAIDLAPWSHLLTIAGVELGRGQGAFGLWATLRERRVTELRLETDLTNVVLRGRTPIALADGRSLDAKLGFARLRAGLRLRADDDEGWRLDAPLLRLEALAAAARERGANAAGRQPDGGMTLDGLTLAGGERFAALADRVEIAPLLALAALSDRPSPALRRWLYLAAPRGQARGLRLAGVRGGALHGEATLVDVGFRPVGRTPAVQGIGGELRVDRDGLAIALSQAPVRFDWPVAFIEPLHVKLGGEVAAWRDVEGWHVQTPTLRIEGTGSDRGLYGVTARGGLLFQGDGTRPRIGLAANVDQAAAVDAKRFWVRHRMPPKTVAWLDAALLGGRVTQGAAVVAGDLDDWPFRAGQGRFEAVAEIADARLHFNPAWPDVESLAGRVRFVGDSFGLEDATGIISGTRITRGSAGIPDFKLPILSIQAEGGGDSADLLALLRASPLRKKHAQTLDSLRLSGPAEVGMTLIQPLKKILGKARLEGMVTLKEVTAADPRYRVAFEGVTGEARFSERGFVAEALQVQVEGRPAEFALAVGGHVADPTQMVQARLHGRLPAVSLLDRSEALAWLKPWIAGEADWDLRVDIARAAAGAKTPPARLRLESDLVGATLAMPAPLRKSAETSLPLSVETRLPLQGGQVQVTLGRLMRLRGRSDANGRFAAAIAFGQAQPAQIPAAGYAIGGELPVLDAGGWIGFVTSARPGDSDVPVTLDLQAGQLDVLDRAFGETRVRLGRTPSGSDIRLEGEQLQGRLQVPAALSQGIRGEFARLYWPAGKPAEPGAPPPPPDDSDPGKLPPLSLSIADLRYGQAKLGAAELQTFPTPEGMRIERFTTKAPELNISASGSWTRLDDRSHSRFAIDFGARSLGQMLDALGFTGMVRDGPTTAKLVAGWPGSPGGFRLDVLEGTLDLEVGEGQLVEVEPGGAGRVLGLLSIAELPRRLTLDFSDFFGKGFSFNTLEGRFVFGGGQARTDDLAINGSSAEIRVRGHADLRAQAYDQTVEVLPKPGGVLTVVGAIAGGPIGAAVGAVTQQVLKKPLGQVTRTVYSVKGPWKKPEVAVIERGPARAAPQRRQGATSVAPVRSKTSRRDPARLARARRG